MVGSCPVCGNVNCAGFSSLSDFSVEIPTFPSEINLVGYLDLIFLTIIISRVTDCPYRKHSCSPFDGFSFDFSAVFLCVRPIV